MKVVEVGWMDGMFLLTCFGNTGHVREWSRPKDESAETDGRSSSISMVKKGNSLGS